MMSEEANACFETRRNAGLRFAQIWLQMRKSRRNRQAKTMLSNGLLWWSKDTCFATGKMLPRGKREHLSV